MTDRFRNDEVVVTGIGVMSPAGRGVDQFWRSILRGTSHIRSNPYFQKPGKEGKAVGLVTFDEDSVFSWADPSQCSGYDRVLRIGDEVIREALNWAGLLEQHEKKNCEIGLYISTAIGAITTMENTIRFSNNGTSVPDGSWHSFSFGNIASRLASDNNLNGPYAVLPTGCAGGCDAIGYGLNAIRAGHTDVAIVGAFEAPVTPFVEAAFERIAATSSRQCPPKQASCPFDINRDGFVLGEGGAALVIEHKTHALARGARPLAVIAGYGSVSSAYHMTDIDTSGCAIARSIELALADAEVPPDAVNHANLHGSSTPMNDVAEANALHAVLQGRANQVPVTSLKSQIGHAMAAANSIEIVALVISILEKVIPPTANLKELDPAIDLDVVSPWPRMFEVTHALKTVSGFGGIHSAIVMKNAEC